MPYIAPASRELLKQGAYPANVGELTFALQQVLLEYLAQFGQLRYVRLAECLGALEGAKLDLIDRVIVPYEHKKREENGDVWPENLLS